MELIQSLAILNRLAAIQDSDVPPIFCDPKITTPDDPDKNGKYVKYSLDPHNQNKPFQDPTTKEPSFRLLSKDTQCALQGDSVQYSNLAADCLFKNTATCFWLEDIGYMPCKGSTRNSYLGRAADWNKKGDDLLYMVLCSDDWDPGFSDMPTNFEQRAIDRFGAGKTLTHYLDTIPMLLRHEMHHKLFPDCESDAQPF